MRTTERYPSRWPTDRQALLVGSALAGAAIVGIGVGLTNLSDSLWEWATALGGIGAGAVFWVTEVLI